MGCADTLIVVRGSWMYGGALTRFSCVASSGHQGINARLDSCPDHESGNPQVDVEFGAGIIE